MRILLDECVPRKLKNHLTEHECQTVPEAGLAGMKNGKLLSVAEQSGFEAFLTLDQGFGYEQNLRGRKISIVIVVARSSRIGDLLTVVPEIQAALRGVGVGQLIRVGG